jgi:TP901 family phage tail tape measure protein
MAVVGELIVLLAGNNAALTASLAKSEAELKTFAATANTQTTAARSAMLGVGLAGAAVAAGAALIGGASIKAAADFQESMAIINTIAHQTPEELNKTGLAIRGLAQESGAGLPDLTSAFYDLLSVGVPTANAMDVLRNSVTLSIGGMSTTTEAANAITTAINSWSIATGKAHLTMADATKVTDIFAKTIEQGGLKANEIAPALAQVSALAAAMNIPLEEVGATWAVMTTRGFTAATSATAMNSALVALQRIPPGMQHLQDVTGKSYEQIAKTQGAQAAMQALVTDAGKYGVALIDVFGRQEALGYALNVTGAAAPAYQAALSNMYNSSGTAAGQAAERAATFDRQMLILSATINDIGISIGTALLPAVQKVMDFILPVVRAVADWTEANPELAKNILLVVGAIGALAVVTAIAGGLFALLLNPIFLIAAAIALLAVAWANNWGGIRDIVQNVAGVIGTAFGAISGFIANLSADPGKALSGLFSGIAAAAPAALAALGNLAGQISGWIGAQVSVWAAQVGQWAQAFVNWIGPMIPPVLAALGTLAGQIVSWIGAQIPVWSNQIGQWAQAFVGWVGTVIPPVLAALGALAGQILGWIGAQLPAWTAQIGKWVSAFVDWVAPMIPIALAALGQWLASTLNFILDHIPDIAAGLFKLADEFVAWILPMIPQLIGALALIAGAIIGWVIPMIPRVLFALGQLGLAIVSWVIGEIPHVVVALFRLAAAFIGWIVPKIPGLLLELGKLGLALVGWIITQGIPMAVVALATLGVKFIGWVATSIPGLLLELGKWVLSLIGFIGESPGRIAGGLIAIGASIISNIIKGIGEVAGAIGAWLFGRPIPAPPSIPGAPTNPRETPRFGAPTTPYVSPYVAPVGGTPTAGSFSGSTTTTVGGVPVSGMFQHGGVVPGFGAQLVIAHGGETIIPPGAGAGGGINSVRHIHIEVGGRELMEYIDREMFGSASGFSSGFTSNSPVTGA